MEDIVIRLRKTRANMIGTDDEPHYWDCHDAAAEIQRLRLTETERKAIEFAIRKSTRLRDGGKTGAALRGLLERLG